MPKPYITGDELPAEDLNVDLKFGGTGVDTGPDGTGNVTITGSDNTYIVKNYSQFLAGGAPRVFTVTPIGCVVHLKIYGDADFTNWTFNFVGKGHAGGAGGAGGSISGAGSDPGDNGSDGSRIGAGLRVGIAKGGVGGQSGGSGNASGGGGGAGGGSVRGKGTDGTIGATDPSTLGGAGGVAYDGIFFDLNSLDAMKMIPCAPGAGGGGGGGGAVSYSGSGSHVGGNGGAGGAGGGCLIIEILGDVTFSSSTFNMDGSAGSAGANGVDATSTTAGGGGGGGGGGGCLVILYNGTKTGSPTVTEAGGAAGAASASATNGAGVGGAGGAGADGAHLIAHNEAIA